MNTKPFEANFREECAEIDRLAEIAAHEAARGESAKDLLDLRTRIYERVISDKILQRLNE